MKDEETITNDNIRREEDMHLFSTPLWYYRLQTKRMNYFNLQFAVIIFSLFISGFLTSIIFAIFYAFLKPVNIIVIIFLILFILVSYIFWRVFTKKKRFDLFENFAYYCEGISLDIDRLSVDSNLPITPTYSINSLEDYSKKIDKLYRKSNKHFKNGLVDFSKKLDNLFVLIKNISDNKSKLAELSKKFNKLAEYVYLNHEINHEALAPIYIEIKDIIKPSRIDKFSNFISNIVALWKKSYYFKKGVYIVISLIFTVIAYIGALNYLGISKDGSFAGAMIVLVGLIGIIFATGKKS